MSTQIAEKTFAYCAADDRVVYIKSIGHELNSPYAYCYYRDEGSVNFSDLYFALDELEPLDQSNTSQHDQTLILNKQLKKAGILT
jgi:hypothetical protein